MKNIKKFITSKNFLFIVLLIVLCFVNMSIFKSGDSDIPQESFSYIFYETNGNDFKLNKSVETLNLILGFMAMFAMLISYFLVVVILVRSVISVTIERKNNIFLKFINGEKIASVESLIMSISVLILILLIYQLFSLSYTTQKYNKLIADISSANEVIEITENDILNIKNQENIILHIESGDKSENDFYITHLLNNVSKATDISTYRFNYIYDNNNYLKTMMDEYNIKSVPFVIIIENRQVSKVIQIDSLVYEIWDYVLLKEGKIYE